MRARTRAALAACWAQVAWHAARGDSLGARSALVKLWERYARSDKRPARTIPERDAESAWQALCAPDTGETEAQLYALAVRRARDLSA